jgi:hypothetical protein
MKTKIIILSSVIALFIMITGVSCHKEKNIYVFNVDVPAVDDQGNLRESFIQSRRFRDVLLVEDHAEAGSWLFCYENTPEDTLLFLTRDSNGIVKGVLNHTFNLMGNPGQITPTNIQGEMTQRYGACYFEGTASFHAVFNQTTTGECYQQKEYDFVCPFRIVSYY